MKGVSFVTTKTPLRIGLAGGGTDLPSFYQKETGAVLNATIDRYLYVTVKKHSPVFLENYRLNYSETEHTQEIDEIRNGIVRECLRFIKISPPLYISTIADLPGSSGLGSSSSFTVGLLNALHCLKGIDVSAAQLAEEACYIELETLKKPIGKQDQYAAAFGGLNHFFFHGDGQVTLSPKHLPEEKIEKFFHCVLLFWTGISRSADPILKEQSAMTCAKMQELCSIRDSSYSLWDALEKEGDLRKVGEILDEGWRNKRSLTSGISSPQIDAWYQKGLDAGAYGGKLLGAGGGGFLLFIAPEEAHEQIKASLGDLIYSKIQYESHGSSVIYRV